VNASLEPYIRAIIVLTTSGESAYRVAKYRPQVPIITVTRNEQLSRRLHLYRGCYPLYYDHPAPDRGTCTVEEWEKDVEKRMEWAMQEGKKLGWLAAGDHVICIQGSRGGAGFTNTLRILPVP
jgi:pyruvate kinase